MKTFGLRNGAGRRSRSGFAKRRQGFLAAIFTLVIAAFSGLEETFAQVVDVDRRTPTADAPKLTLAELLRQVEANHPKLGGAELERRVAEAKLLEKRGAFDPVATASSEFLRYNSSSTPGKSALAFQNQAGVELATRSGIKFFAGSRVNFGKVKSPLSATGGTGEYFAGASVPIFRDRRVNAKSIAEQKAVNEVSAASDAVSAVRFELIRNAAASYWDWVAAKQKLAVNETLFSLADERAGQVAARVKSGELPPIDSTEAATEVQRRMGNVVKSREELQKAAIKLGLYRWRADGLPDDLPDAASAPDSFQTPNVLPDFVIREGIQRAFDRSPQLRILTIERDQNQLDARLAANDRRPRLDLYLAPGYDTGFTGTGATFKFGATVELPLRTRSADGRFAAANLKSEKAELARRTEQQNIVAQIREAAASVNASHDRYLLALQELNLMRDLERGERTRFAAGDSTLFLVNQRERAAAEAQIKLIEIAAAYEQSMVAFRIAALEY